MAQRHVAVGDVTLDTVELGAGPPLLFLHGEDGLMHCRPLLDDLASSYRVIAPHHPAWGESTRPAHIGETRDLGLVYAELVESLEAPPLVLGCSFGGWVAAELGVLTRAPLAAIVLAAPTGVKIGGREDRDFADIWIAAFDDLPGILYGDPARSPVLVDRPDEDYLYLAKAQEATARYCWKPYMHDPTLAPWLRRIAAPTLVVAGSEDRFALLEGYYGRYATLIGERGAELRTIEGAGHRVEEDAPAELAAIVREFDSERAAAAVGASSGDQ